MPTRCEWVPEGDPHFGLNKGHLAFALEGIRLKGRWHLVRMKPRPPANKKNEWLLIKVDDAFARREGERDITEEETTSTTEEPATSTTETPSTTVPSQPPVAPPEIQDLFEEFVTQFNQATDDDDVDWALDGVESKTELFAERGKDRRRVVGGLLADHEFGRPTQFEVISAGESGAIEDGTVQLSREVEREVRHQGLSANHVAAGRLRAGPGSQLRHSRNNDKV